MDTPPPQPEPPDEPVDGARVRRAIALIVASVVVIGGAAVGYLRPLTFGGTPGPAILPVSVASSDYQVTAMDFVNPMTGWVVARFTDDDFLVMRTTDGGQRWTPELSGPTYGAGTYMKFFDSYDGVFALTNARPLLYRTTDGGVTWIPQAALTAQTDVLSWSFSDPAHGWMLVVDPQTKDGTKLYRTPDAGGSWVDLGSPVRAPDRAFGVAFATSTAGWLVTQSAGPYAYTSVDLGATWSKVELPAPAAGWPRGEQYLVSAQPTGMTGVIVSAAAFTPAVGRSPASSTIVGYPPLEVQTYDGGAAVVYTYGLAAEMVRFQPSDVAWTANLQVDAPDQRFLGSEDGGVTWSQISVPASPGAVGFYDTWNWWWVGLDRQSETANAGQSWTDPRPVGAPLPVAGSLQVLDSRHGWLVVAGMRPELAATDDGGATWRIVALPPMSGRFTP